MSLTKDLVPLVVPLVALQPPRLHLTLCSGSPVEWIEIALEAVFSSNDGSWRETQNGHSHLRAVQLLPVPRTEALKTRPQAPVQGTPLARA